MFELQPRDSGGDNTQATSREDKVRTLGPHSPSELYYIGPDLCVDVIVPEVSGSGSDESVE